MKINPLTLIFFLITALLVSCSKKEGKKDGSARFDCIMNIRNVQQAVRGHQNIHGMKDGDQIDWNEILGPNGYLDEPVCPGGGTYAFTNTIPEAGILACKCSLAESDRHKIEDDQDW